MDLLNIIYIVISVAVTLIGTGVPAIIGMVKSLKARKEARAAELAAKTEAEKAEAEAAKEKANAELLAHAKTLITSAEVMYKDYDKMMKAQGSSAGPLKKDIVLTKIQSYALQNGCEFDAEAWSDKIDELVKFTKSVNAK